jgi:hypothetical protein
MRKHFCFPFLSFVSRLGSRSGEGGNKEETLNRKSSMSCLLVTEDDYNMDGSDLDDDIDVSCQEYENIDFDDNANSLDDLHDRPSQRHHIIFRRLYDSFIRFQRWWISLFRRLVIKNS